MHAEEQPTAHQSIVDRQSSRPRPRNRHRLPPRKFQSFRGRSGDRVIASAGSPPATHHRACRRPSSRFPIAARHQYQIRNPFPITAINGRNAQLTAIPTATHGPAPQIPHFRPARAPPQHGGRRHPAESRPQCRRCNIAEPPKPIFQLPRCGRRPGTHGHCVASSAAPLISGARQTHHRPRETARHRHHPVTRRRHDSPNRVLSSSPARSHERSAPAR